LADSPSIHHTPTPPSLHSFPTRRSSDLVREREARHFKADLAAATTVPAQLLSRGLARTEETTVRIPELNGDTWRSDTRRQFDRRSEEHTSELQSRGHLVCRLLLEKKKYI